MSVGNGPVDAWIAHDRIGERRPPFSWNSAVLREDVGWNVEHAVSQRGSAHRRVSMGFPWA